MVKLFLGFVLFIVLIVINLVAVGVRMGAQGTYWAALVTLLQIAADFGGAAVLLVGVGMWLDRTIFRPQQRVRGVIRPQVVPPRNAVYQYEETPFNQPFQDNGWRRVTKHEHPTCKVLNAQAQGWQLQDATLPTTEQPPRSNSEAIQNMKRARRGSNIYRPR